MGLGTIAAVLALSACGGGASSTAAPPASAKPAASTEPASASAKPAVSAATGSRAKIQSAWVALTAGQAPSWTANDAGYFTKEGLDVELTFIEGSAKAAAAMVGGSVQNGEMAAEGTIRSIVGGADLVIVAGFNNYSPFRLVADPAFNKVSDLKGRTIATTQGGSADEFILTKVLQMNGLSKQDVNVTYMQGGDPARLAALASHRIDASMVSADYARQAIKQGDKILLDTIPLKIPHPQNTLVTTRSYLRSHQAETLSFLKAEAEGIHRFKTDKAFGFQVMSKYLKTSDQDTLEGSYEAYTQLIPNDMLLLPEAVQAVLDLDQIKGHKPADFYDMSLVEQLNSSGFIKSLST